MIVSRFMWTKLVTNKNSCLQDALVAHITGLTLEELCGQLKDGKIRPIVALKAYQTKVTNFSISIDVKY